MKMKKAKSGSSLGMKSVKAGYDKNPGVTRADIIVAAKKKAKGGTKMKKAQGGDNLNLVNQYSGSSSGGSSPESMLRTRQYKRLGRLAAKNPNRAKRVAGRMTERATREARGKKYMSTNIAKLMPATPTLKKGGKMKKMRGGGTISPSKSSTSTRLSTYGRTIGKNTAGKAKGGTKMKKCKYGC